MQTFNTIDVLRLDVGVRPSSELVNLIKNPHGRQGAWGWITPPEGVTVAGSYLNGGGSNDLTSSTYLSFEVVNVVSGTPAWFTSEPEPVTAGQWLSARIRLRATFTSARAGEISVIFYDKNGALVGGSRSQVKSIPNSAAVNSVHYTTPIQVPATATHAAMRLDVLSGANGPRTLRFDQAMLGCASTSAALDIMQTRYTEPYTYTDVLAAAHEITLERTGLAVSTLSVKMRSATLDPAVNAMLRPGNPIRLMASGADGYGAITYAYEPLFVGEIQKSQVNYDLTAADPEKRTVISITGVDANARLANLKQPTGVATISDLRYLLEGCGVPFEVNGTNNLIPGLPVTVAKNDNASVLDQIAMTRDTRLGHAWTSRWGVLTARDANTMSTTQQASLGEADYNADIDIDYDTARCINVVTVKRIGLDTESKSIETVFGPFTSDTSVREWGPFSDEFTVLGMADANVEAYAQSILAANAVPKVRVNALTIPILDGTDLKSEAGPDGLQKRAHLDLNDYVRVVNARAAIDETMRVTTIRHRIRPDRWLVDLEFASSSGVAMPAAAPALPEGEVIGGSLSPIGEVRMYAGSTEPTGWKFCRGQALSKTTYPKLFAVIGYTYGGSGDSFNVPDLKARSPIGIGGAASSGSAGNTYSLGQKYGHEALAQHNHGVTDGGHAHNYDELTLDYYAYPHNAPPVIGHTGTARTIRPTSSVGSNITIQNAGSGNAGNVHPVIGLNFLIRVST